jgi:hypothetical protein
LNGIRFELQEKERELVEQAIVFNSFNSIVSSLTQMPPSHILAWITAADALGLIDTVIPATKDEILNALKTVGEDTKLSRLEKFARTAGGINWLEILLGVDIPTSSEFAGV